MMLSQSESRESLNTRYRVADRPGVKRAIAVEFGCLIIIWFADYTARVRANPKSRDQDALSHGSTVASVFNFASKDCNDVCDDGRSSARPRRFDQCAAGRKVFLTQPSDFDRILHARCTDKTAVDCVGPAMIGANKQKALPPGIFNIVTGDGLTVGDAIVRHPDIKRIAFIGSPATGRAIQRAAAECAVKHVTLELGGKNPLIAFPDVDPDIVADAAVRGMNFSWQGQSCGSTSQLLLHADIYDTVLDRVVARVRALKLGDPADPETGMGPVNSRVQYDKVFSFFASAGADGARLMTGGQRPVGATFHKGFWIEPTVYAEVEPGMRLWREEVFGPILSVGRWHEFDDVIEKANSTEYGLTGAVWTNNLRDALTTIRRIRSGHIWVNGCSNHFLGVPFGGMKNSGVGREEGIEEMFSYTETKTVNIMLGRA